MPAIDLKIEQLVLDPDNPRIPHSEGQQETLQTNTIASQTSMRELPGRGLGHSGAE
jgi:hypothetical protein